MTASRWSHRAPLRSDRLRSACIWTRVAIPKCIRLSQSASHSGRSSLFQSTSPPCVPSRVCSRFRSAPPSHASSWPARGKTCGEARNGTISELTSGMHSARVVDNGTIGCVSCGPLLCCAPRGQASPRVDRLEVLEGDQHGL
eukprot:scaffold27438_cov108-Isochrysis_galbana.AAC.7